MEKINIFTDKEIEIDIPTLMDSRALWCANSGGGKSYAFRKLLEEINNQVMVIVLDVEGEYKTLREKYDYLLIGGDGDIPISLKSAPLLPKKLFELNVSTIIDISELKSGERIQYVKKFLEALMELPKKYWKPCLLGIEETHKLCGQQDRHDSGPAVIDVFTRGRKRGICGVAVTQRIAKLHKDVVAECNNVFSGRMWLPNDIKTASQILGISASESMELLRNLDPGEYHCFGPAINKNVQRGKIGEVKTTHPKVGMDLREHISPPTENIKKILSELANLPQKAEEKLKEKADYLRKIRELEAKLRIQEKEYLKKGSGNIAEQMKGVKETNNRLRLAESTRDKMIKVAQLSDFKLKTTQEQLRISENTYKEAVNIIKPVYKMIQRLVEAEKQIAVLFNNQWKGYATKPQAIVTIKEPKPLPTPKPMFPEPKPNPIVLSPKYEMQPFEKEKITGGAKRMLQAVAMFYPKEITKPRIGAIAGLSYKSGSFTTYIATLKRNGLIEPSGNGGLIATQDGLEEAGDVEKLPSDPEALIEMWVGIVKGGAGRMLKVLAEIYPEAINKEELGYRVDMSYTSGSFTTYISTLKRNGLIVVQGGSIKASDELFE